MQIFIAYKFVYMLLLFIFIAVCDYTKKTLNFNFKVDMSIHAQQVVSVYFKPKVSLNLQLKLVKYPVYQKYII